MFHTSDQGHIIIVYFTIICLLKYCCLYNQYHLRYWCEFFRMLFCKLYSSFWCLVWKYCITNFDIKWKTSSLLQISSVVIFPINFVLMQYYIVFKTKVLSYCQNWDIKWKFGVESTTCKKLHINISNGIDFIGNNTLKGRL